MQRLSRKFATAEKLLSAPELVPAAEPGRFGLPAFGSSMPAVREGSAELADRGVHRDTLRIRAFPFARAVEEFVAAHERVFVVEQNRDGQLRQLLVDACGIDPARLRPVPNYHDTPITARFVTRAVLDRLSDAEIVPFRKAVS